MSETVLHRSPSDLKIKQESIKKREYAGKEKEDFIFNVIFLEP